MQDKAIIIAGAASGIGAATARKLAANGARVVVADINEAGAAATAEAIRQLAGRSRRISSRMAGPT
ncbi:SDR family NAD(P)-dependent oxidoreductase [Sphingopyxis sp. USTB-05]|uniref:SDR family NAD(P)-dependent oxidoreductase n=1 Tax=Sphingopyxis sp. USTB-05 TaxID=2830667 RepID=UPI002078729A|nr:SDR family NAD(P)-dependent oxidoreductase [Sphingopyxis sp. USTB-05]USI77627.1 SDR family NAD(P)-dependent oxidoreductase [Sphingopyxis sp. USTB-05]